MLMVMIMMTHVSLQTDPMFDAGDLGLLPAGPPMAESSLHQGRHSRLLRWMGGPTT
jgi:hypothetical protein